jgi:hypothetical protein
MDYELAKQLRDAGFLQAGTGRWIGPPDKVFWRSGDRVYVATFEELLEACRKDVESLTQEFSLAGDEWVASAFGRSKSARGDTPADAMARLWLAVHGDAGQCG